MYNILKDSQKICETKSSALDRYVDSHHNFLWGF